MIFMDFLLKRLITKILSMVLSFTKIIYWQFSFLPIWTQYVPYRLLKFGSIYKVDIFHGVCTYWEVHFFCLNSVGHLTTILKFFPVNKDYMILTLVYMAVLVLLLTKIFCMDDSSFLSSIYVSINLYCTHIYCYWRRVCGLHIFL